MNLWNVKYNEFQEYAKVKFKKSINNILIQDNTRAKLYCTDNTVETVFSWDFDYLEVPRMSIEWALYAKN